MTLDQEIARQRTARLKQLREDRQETVGSTRALLKTQQEIRRAIGQAMQHGAETVPEVAEASGQAADQVLWHITAMKKYGLVAEVGKRGDYYRYALVQEVKE
jgi:predicted transcriptional regulator